MLLENLLQGVALGFPAPLPFGHGHGMVLPEQLQDEPPLLLRHDRQLVVKLLLGASVRVGEPHLRPRQDDRSEGREFALDENPPLR